MKDNTPKPIELLHEAALQGDVSLLQDLLLRDPLLLHRLPSSSTTSPLHMACNLGHTNFVLELLCRSPSRMEELDPNDKSSLLHLAARNDHLELVTSLVSINPSLCYARDIHGRTPIHVAAIKGQLHVLEELLRSMPEAARERVGLLLDKSGGDTIMHLCARFNMLEALMLAVRMVGDVEMLNATNVEGNTILHVAVANKHLEVVEFLLRDKRLNKNTPNSNGLTAMDVFETSPNNTNVDDQLRLTLQREKVLPSEFLKKEREKDKHLNWLEKQRSALMVVASLIATMAFQAGVNPANGLMQLDNDPLQQSATNIAPTRESSDWHNSHSSFLAHYKQTYISGFLICNTTGFVISMTSILLLISGLPCRRFFMALVMVMMWVAVLAMLFSYGYSSIAMLPARYIDSDYTVIAFVYESIQMVWWCLMGVLLVGHIIRWALRFIKHCKCCISNST